MKKNECLDFYEKELKRQETPYEQWILANEIFDVENSSYQSNKDKIKLIGMNQVNEKFDLSSYQEEILVFAGENGIVSEQALAVIWDFFADHKQAVLAYADEDEMDKDSKKRSNPWFKPEYTPDTLLSSFFIGNIFAVRKASVLKCEYLATDDYMLNIYDFVLKIVEISDAIEHIPYVLFHQTDKNISESVIGASARYDDIKIEACRRRKMKAKMIDCNGKTEKEIKNESFPSISRHKDEIKSVFYELDNLPLVSIIIPSKNHFKALKTCLDSILTTSTYQNIEFIIVDNGSTTEQRKKIVEYLQLKFDNTENNPCQMNCYYEYEEAEFNFSKMCNYGATKANGEYIVFLNDDIEIITPNWIEIMLGQAAQKLTGAVGAKLLYPSNHKIQHIGITNMGIGPVHKLNGFEDYKIYSHGENCLVLNKIAVTAACLMIAKEKFEKAGKFPEDMPVAYNDVALCFGLLKCGYLNVVRNDVSFIHYESLSRGSDDTPAKKHRLQNERILLYEKYPMWKGIDPFYSKDYVQYKRDTDYTCNFMYDYEKENQMPIVQLSTPEQKIILGKKHSENKMIRKLTQEDALMFSIENVYETRPEEIAKELVFHFDNEQKNEVDYVQIEGWAALKNMDNSNFLYKILLKDEEGNILICDTYIKVRRDVEEMMKGAQAINAALSGIVTRIPHDELKQGIYRFGVTAQSRVTGKFSYTSWNEQLCLFYLKK